MDQNNAIEVRDIHKKFKIYHDKGRMLKERAINWSRNQYEEHWVLKGISFDVKKGEAVGLIGQNGCGKSTILKLLTRIMYPDSGTIEMDGRVSSLLELGAGFHPDLSGRENIYINASIFGLTKKEIDQRVEDIIEFSELENFIDNPVRTYSSGMYMRLAFSVAINVDADILLIDEILAVGDVNFQAKCFNKLMEIKGSGTTIILVSHSTGQIEQICNRSIWIQDGVIQEDGIPMDVHRKYVNYMCQQRNVEGGIKKEVVPQNAESNDFADKPKTEEIIEEDAIEELAEEEKVLIELVKITDAQETTKKVFYLGERFKIEICLSAREKIKDYYIELNVVRADGLFCYGCSTAIDKIACDEWIGEKKIGVEFEKINLLAGKYHIDLHLANADGSTILFAGNIAEFEITSYDVERGLVYLEHAWVNCE